VDVTEINASEEDAVWLWAVEIQGEWISLRGAWNDILSWILINKKNENKNI